MNSRFPLFASVLAGTALVIRERRARRAVERFAAAGLETLLNAIEANDAQTGQHVRRVATYALIIADSAGLDERQCHAIERVALFHDIGKIHEALFDIVHDHTKLSADDRRIMEGWFEHLRRWRTDDFVRSRSRKLKPDEEVYAFQTNSSNLIFVFSLNADVATILSILTKETLEKFQGASAVA